jgi:hypothetical protein
VGDKLLPEDDHVLFLQTHHRQQRPAHQQVHTPFTSQTYFLTYRQSASRTSHRLCRVSWLLT